MKSRRKFSPKFKAKVALEAIKEQQSTAELCQKYEISPAQIGQWKQLFLENASSVFEKGSKAIKQESDHEGALNKLYSKIGQLQVENDFLKKASSK
ncbi:transposase [Persicobacter psychrovividus]|uniref:Transposase n=1 Tax=Persicobacter psychrovividus TaxID=387638 RepID=A0ABM7VBL3_9BACT|nr:transposase [Persicobacter psychrovividus]BDC98327.1 transposase [Persicobacter psychrovividus]BDC98664.1 transposase [Persicobacter psychrovividus]BDC99485.1 transposase [Persicobacter psychrovividus]BDD00537.1 transposase [Persicobacter psychrovividus]